MRASSIILALALSLAIQPSLAQQNSHQQEAQTVASRVTFIITADILIPGDSSYALPLSIVEKLEQQPRLAELNLRGSHAPVEVAGKFEARFLFEGMQAFRLWYESEQTQSLLTDLKEHSGRSMLDFAMHVQQSTPPSN
jgi:hypothetical protein